MSAKKYQEALDTYKQVEAIVLERVNLIIDVAKRIQGNGWQRVAVPSDKYDFPAAVVNTGTMLPSTIPTIDQLGESLAYWHVARDEMLIAWSWVPNEERSNLEPPPETTL